MAACEILHILTKKDTILYIWLKTKSHDKLELKVYKIQFIIPNQ